MDTSWEDCFAKNVDGSDYFEPVSSRRAAVLVGLFYSSHNNELHVLLTQRSNKLRSHKGEVCLPGGKTDDGETNIQTALREADEEVGLKRNHVQKVLGEVPPRLSAHLLSVTPVICLIDTPAILISNRCTRTSIKSFNEKTNDDDTKDSFQVVPNPHEVDSVFTVPLRLFHESSSCHSYYDYTTFYNHTVRIHEFQYSCKNNGQDYYLIWGLTAHILINVAARVYRNTTNEETNVIELDPPGLPRHVDLRVMEKTTTDDEEDHKIVVSVCADG